MNTPSLALNWELWRRNRSGFALLGVLLLACSALRWHVADLERRAESGRAQFQELTRGAVDVNTLLPNVEGRAAPAHAELEVGRVGFSGDIAPGTRLTWQGALSAGAAPTLDVKLGDLSVSSDEPLPPRLRISVEGGRRQTVNFLGALEFADRVAGMISKAAMWRSGALAWSVISFGFSLLVLFAVFGAAEPHTTRGFTGIPPRRFALPVPTAVLVLWPALLGAVVMVVTITLWVRSVLSPLTQAPTRVPILYWAAVFTAGLAWFQAAVWGLVSFPKLRVASISVIVLSVLGLALWPFAGPGKLIAWWAEKETALTWSGLGFTALGVLTAWVGAAQERQGRWSGRSWTVPWPGLLARTFFHQSCFGTVRRAQAWIEWRRNGRVALLLWAVGVSIVLGCDLAARLIGPSLRPVADAVLNVAPIALTVWLIIVGLNLARDPANKQPALSSFTATRPVPTGMLFEAKVLLAIRLWLGTLVILGAAWVATILLAGMFEAISGDLYDSWVRPSRGVSPGGWIEDWPSAETLAVVGLMLAFSAHVLIGILPLCLSGRLPGFPWSLLPLVLVYGGCVHLWQRLLRASPETIALTLVLMGGLKIAIAFVGFRRAIYLGISSAGAVAAYVIFWLVAAGLLVQVTLVSAGRGGWSTDSVASVGLAFLLVPLARVALSPLALAVNRHR